MVGRRDEWVSGTLVLNMAIFTQSGGEPASRPLSVQDLRQVLDACCMDNTQCLEVAVVFELEL